jgi:2-keto-4-pentenoate hydratase/2-oxohepta-3-ene-1,7-dioic acid hydratase in catechol pathway
MKYVRFAHQDKIAYGILEDQIIRVIDGDLFGEFSLSSQTVNLDSVKLLAPCKPSKAVCIGLNYHDHAKEMGSPLPKEPLMFIKPSSAVTDPDGIIFYPAITKNLHYEAELAVVIKKIAKHVKREQAADYILGYTCANDVTARDLQKSDGQWTRGKSFDTFLPLGPCIDTEVYPGSLGIKLYLNDEVKQSSNTDQLIFPVPLLIEKITEVMTLYPGDVILTGTSSGVGPMQIGDKVVVELQGIGRLANVIQRDN